MMMMTGIIYSLRTQINQMEAALMRLKIFIIRLKMRLNIQKGLGLLKMAQRNIL